MGIFKLKAKQEQPKPATKVESVEDKNNKPIPSVTQKPIVPTQRELEAIRKRQAADEYSRKQVAKLSMATDFCVAMLHRKDYDSKMVDDALSLAETLMRRTVESKLYDFSSEKKSPKKKSVK